MYHVLIKSGTSGYYDYDGCDMSVAEIENNNIPNVGDILEIDRVNLVGEEKHLDVNNYLVREVRRIISIDNINNKQNEWIKVYVIKIS